MIGDIDQRSRGNAGSCDDVGTVDPDMALLEAGCATRRDRDNEPITGSRCFSNHSLMVTDGQRPLSPPSYLVEPVVLRSRKIISSAELSRGAFANEPYSATVSNPASRNSARR